MKTNDMDYVVASVLSAIRLDNMFEVNQRRDKKLILCNRRPDSRRPAFSDKDVERLDVEDLKQLTASYMAKYDTVHFIYDDSYVDQVDYYQNMQALVYLFAILKPKAMLYVYPKSSRYEKTESKTADRMRTMSEVNELLAQYEQRKTQVEATTDDWSDFWNSQELNA